MSPRLEYGLSLVCLKANLTHHICLSSNALTETRGTYDAGSVEWWVPNVRVSSQTLVWRLSLSGGGEVQAGAHEKESQVLKAVEASGYDEFLASFLCALFKVLIDLSAV